MIFRRGISPRLSRFSGAYISSQLGRLCLLAASGLPKWVEPPRRLRGGSMPRLSAAGISGIQAGEDVKLFGVERCAKTLSLLGVAAGLSG